MFAKLFSLMGMMFLMMATGALLRKKNIITVEAKKSLTDLILYVILPCNIVKAFSMELGGSAWMSLTGVLAASVLIQVLCLILAKTIYRKMDAGEKAVYQYATICSNSGFMGNPLAYGVFGDTGLLYASVFLIPQRIVMWTAGISYFSRETDKRQAVKNVLIHPCMVAVYIGLVLMLTGFHLPGPLGSTVDAFSDCTTAMTMMYIGTILTEADFRTIVSPKQLYFAAVRLVLIPLVVYGVCLALRVDSLVAGVCVLLTAMPAGSTTSLLAAKYGADEESAARCVVFTTALSVITLPVWSVILLR